jgi:hypothetical protein
VLLGLGVLAVFACIRAAQIDRAMEHGNPASFEVTGCDMQSRTILRRPVVDPPPCPDSAPGEDSFPSPGISSSKAEEHSR